jgi:hypothetical protein
LFEKKLTLNSKYLQQHTKSPLFSDADIFVKFKLRVMFGGPVHSLSSASQMTDSIQPSTFALQNPDKSSKANPRARSLLSDYHPSQHVLNGSHSNSAL